MEVVFSITLPRDSGSVPVVRQLCRCSFRALGVQEDCSHDLELVVTEACTNVLKHAAEGIEEYEVTVRTGARVCDIRVKDTGRGSNFDAHGREEAHATAEGGRGIHLMRLLADRLQFVSDGSGTVVHLEKALDLRDDSPLRRAVHPTGAVPAVPYTGP